MEGQVVKDRGKRKDFSSKGKEVENTREEHI